jgi:hypothetical protein
MGVRSTIECPADDTGRAAATKPPNAFGSGRGPLSGPLVIEESHKSNCGHPRQVNENRRRTKHHETSNE